MSTLSTHHTGTPTLPRCRECGSGPSPAPPSPRPIPSPAGDLATSLPLPGLSNGPKVHDFLTVGAAAPLQEAVIPGLQFGQDYYEDLAAKYTHKKELLLKGLDDLRIPHNRPEGAYYVLLDISEFGYDSDLQFCEDLAREVGVGAVPGSSFFREPGESPGSSAFCQER